MLAPDSLTCTTFLFLSLLLAGVVQTIWMKSHYSHRFRVAIDAGRTLRNRRIFGQNKTWRGFVIMIPATGIAFVLFQAVIRWATRNEHALWPLSIGQYFLLGCWAGFGFMLFELPNSFLKRQLDIEPGQPASSPAMRRIGFVLDQVDSIIGGLLAVWLFVPIPFATWISLLLIGAAAHYAFNWVLLRLGLRTRAA